MWRVTLVRSASEHGSCGWACAFVVVCERSPQRGQWVSVGLEHGQAVGLEVVPNSHHTLNAGLGRGQHCAVPIERESRHLTAHRDNTLWGDIDATLTVIKCSASVKKDYGTLITCCGISFKTCYSTTSTAPARPSIWSGMAYYDNSGAICECVLCVYSGFFIKLCVTPYQCGRWRTSAVRRRSSWRRWWRDRDTPPYPQT